MYFIVNLVFVNYIHNYTGCLVCMVNLDINDNEQLLDGILQNFSLDSSTLLSTHLKDFIMQCKIVQKSFWSNKGKLIRCLD